MQVVWDSGVLVRTECFQLVTRWGHSDFDGDPRVR